jgi:hypothetical protein
MEKMTTRVILLPVWQMADTSFIQIPLAKSLSLGSYWTSRKAGKCSC